MPPASRWAGVVGKEPGLLRMTSEQVAGEVEVVLVAGLRRDLDAHGGDLEEDEVGGGVAVRQPDGRVRAEAYGTLEVPGGLCGGEIEGSNRRPIRLSPSVNR
ncbi:MAG: hypothetical protein ACREA0_03075 [bacterium]